MSLIKNESNIDTILDNLSKLEIKVKETNAEYLYNNKKVPRVTEILSAMLAEPGLMNWSNNLGWKRISYSSFMREAADKGSYTHLAIEKFLKKEDFKISNFKIMNFNIQLSVENAFQSFKKWWLDIHREYSNIELVLSEETLIGPYFGGTCDCVLKVDGKYWLVDFKTSNHMSYNYTLQLSAYRLLLKELKGINIDRCIILKLKKDDIKYNTYELDMSIEKHREFTDSCLQTFKLLTAAYIMRLKTTEEYKNIYKIIY